MSTLYCPYWCGWHKKWGPDDDPLELMADHLYEVHPHEYVSQIVVDPTREIRLTEAPDEPR